ncbi:MAG TPA: hypothetical protein VMP12_07585 [Candidatus Sulfotelmatobacter sp.]|nr:hypothetical protein [Candidatus Sulfotelmatobacter sp.]
MNVRITSVRSRQFRTTSPVAIGIASRFYLKQFFALTLLIFGSALFAGSSWAGNPPGYAYCGTYGSYVLLYRSNDNLEELGKLRCGEKVEVLSRYFDYVQVRAADGRVGWVNWSELSSAPGAAPSKNFGMTDTTSKPQGAVVGLLNNAAIVKMRTQRIGADVIVAKIQSSPCEFDTSPAALQKLKQAGVPDKVILAMVMAPSASAPPPAPKAPEFVDVKVPGGTLVDLELTYAASSDDATEGRPLLMTVAHDVMVDGAVVFRAGAEAHARVASFKEPGFMNRPPGQVSWTMDYVTAANGDHVSADFFSKDAAANPMSAVMGSPGPSWEFKKGKPAVVAAKTKFQVVLNKKGLVVRVPQADVQARAADSDSAEPGDASPGGNGKP